MQRRLAAVYLADGLHQVGRAGVLQQVAQRPGLDGREDVVVAGEAGQHQDAGRQVAPGQAADRLQAVHPGHEQVHQHHVRAQPLHQPHRRLAVGRLADHLQFGLGGQQRLHAAAHDRLVVHHHHPDH